jgi:hypothetical protein
MSGSQTVKGRTVDIDTNVFQLLGESQSPLGDDPIVGLPLATV